MPRSISRRDALFRVGATASVMGGVGSAAWWRWDQVGPTAAQAAQKPQVRDFRVSPQHDLPELVIAKNLPDPAALTRKALDAIGSMQRFVSRGDVVVIKPNIGWDRSPIQAANTNPDVVAALVKAAFDAGAKRVTVTDVSCNQAERSFQRSGIWQKAHAAGAHVVIPSDHRFRTMRLGGEVLDEWPVFTPLVDADKIINVPVAKHHSLAKFTCALKNWYGLIGGRRNRLHQKLDVSIADLATFMRPTLTVIDATRVLVRNGPQGGNIDDTRQLDTVIATTDQVAGDAYACTLIGLKPEQIGYLELAHKRGLGTMHWEKLRVREV